MRDLKIDSLKGFLIICVLWGHMCVLVTGLTNADATLWNTFFELINTYFPVYYFHMPLFFALSIIFVRSINFELVKKRVLTILFPYVFWFVWPHLDTGLIHPLVTIKHLLYGNWINIVSILWFLPALFSVNIYYALYRKYSHKKYVGIFFVLAGIIFLLAKSIAQTYHVMIPFGLDLAIYLFPYLFIIDTIYKHKHFFTKYNKWYALLLIPVGISAVRLIDYYEPMKDYTPYIARIDLAQFSVPFTVIGYGAMMLLSSAIVIFFLIINPVKILSYIGKYSMPIYLLHLVVMGKLIMIYNKVILLNNPRLFLVVILISFSIIIISSIVISKLLTKLSKYAKYIGMVA
ncbi:MAG: acyltransferase [Patescibacteria group bacterium]|jgi:fucose 4-O-acetylase-like acetyltransferase